MTDEVKRLWGSNIKGGRQVLGLRQEDLADSLQIRQSTVSRWERGLIAPRDGMKVRIANLLRQDVRQLFPLTRSAA